MASTLMVLGAAAAAGSNLTGGLEADRVWEQLSGPAKEVLHTHALLGDWLPWAFAALAAWRLGLQFVGFLARTRPFYVMLAVISGAAILYQGHEGGELVYTYGVGTSLMPSASASPSASPEEAPTPSVPTALPTVFVPSAAATPAPSPPATTSPSAAPYAATPTAAASPSSANAGAPAASASASPLPSAMPSASPSSTPSAKRTSTSL
jgi:uncharacterized membrane protein